MLARGTSKCSLDIVNSVVCVIFYRLRNFGMREPITVVHGKSVVCEDSLLGKEFAVETQEAFIRRARRWTCSYSVWMLRRVNLGSGVQVFSWTLC